jgi:hypothetical protein
MRGLRRRSVTSAAPDDEGPVLLLFVLVVVRVRMWAFPRERAKTPPAMD